ncbi:MAG TPA: 6-phosphogluconolactonase [Myxococcales bacterium]|jgi:6-phosphogluconolactonase|nr:6-phosphogluconolactonase [Myxococcales bacterium]
MTEVAVVTDVAAAAAELFVEATAGAAAARGRAAVALTGGSSAPPFFAQLRTLRVPWQQVQVYFTDERAVPADDPLSNYRMAREGLLQHVAPAGIHRMRGEAKDLPAEAQRCAEDLRRGLGTPPRLDLVLLGLGPDGHICSLFAGVAASAERGDAELVRAVEPPVHVEPKVARLTLTPFLVVTARMVVLQVTGASKAGVLARAIKGEEDLVACPAQWLRKVSGRAVVVADAAAASGL